MQSIKMNLIDRVDTFAQVIKNSFCTDANHHPLDMEETMTSIMYDLTELRARHHALYIVGNGGSAAVASHALVDFVNVAKIRTHVLHESSLITCMANDYHYENAYSRALSIYIQPEDLLIAISSSGKSANICNAVQVAKQQGIKVLTLTGFNQDNPLRRLGDINIWLNSHDYGYVEVGHQFILHNLSDRFGIEHVKHIANIEQMRV